MKPHACLGKPKTSLAWALAAGVLAPCVAQAWQPACGPLKTRWAKDVSPQHAHPEYPRPQLVRKEWLNLNGLWELSISATDTARDTNMPVMTGIARPFFQNTASARPPSSAPLVRPRNEKAAFKTNSTWRLREATRIRAAAQATVETLLKRKKNDSLRCGNTCLTKSMVETDASEVRAELTEDMAADKIATIKKPFSR